MFKVETAPICSVTGALRCGALLLGFVAALVGIAIERGAIRGLGQLVVELLGERLPADVEGRSWAGC